MGKSTSEAGHSVNISNFKLLADYCGGFGDKYNPSNEDLTVANLLALWAKANGEDAAASKAEGSSKEPINQRNLIFQPVSGLVTQVVGAVNSSKANDLVKADVKGIADRIRGEDRKPKVKAGEGGTDAEMSAISRSHLSYVQRAKSFRNLVDLLATIKEYKPNEEPLKVVNLQALLAQMEAANEGIGVIVDTVDKAELERDRTLYKPDTGMLDVARDCKEYVKSVFKASSAEFKKVSKIKFRDLPPDEKAKL